MQINPLTLATQTTPAVAAGVQLLRVTAGDVTQVQTGMTVAVRVLTGGSGEAVVDLGGRPVTVRGAVNLTAGDVLNVRVNGGSNPTLEVVGQQTQPTKAPASTTLPPNQSAEPRTAVADVIRQEPNGQIRVTLDGEETVATSQQPLQPGGRYVVQVERTPAGVVLKPLPETPHLPTQVATALLRTDRPPPLADTLPPLLRELDTLPPQPKVQVAAAEVREAVRAITAAPDQPPSVRNLEAVVRDGGQQFEAKLAAGVAPATVEIEAAVVPASDAEAPNSSSPRSGVIRAEDWPSPTPPRRGEVGTVAPPPVPGEGQSGENPSPAAGAGAPRGDLSPAGRGGAPGDISSAAERGIAVPTEPNDDGKRVDTALPAADLKGGLLKLLKAVPELAPTLPMATATLDGIERQQAVNVLAQQNGGLYVFQVPFLDGPHWRTLSLGVEPDRDGGRDGTGRPTGFRVMMHVPLSDLGETWIDAGADGPRLRAVLYLADEPTRDRLRPDLPELKRELQSAGFADVLLDVRSSAELTERQRRRANAMRAGVPEGGGLLDVRA